MAKQRTENDLVLAKQIGRNIKKLRESLKMTQDELSDITGRSNLSKIERGVSLPDIPTLIKLADKLNTTPGNILSSGLAITSGEEYLTKEIYESMAQMGGEDRAKFLELMARAAKGFIR